MTIPKINSAHGSDTRNIINRAIDLINVQGKTIQDLVAKGQLTPAQYAELIQTINGLVEKGHITLNDMSSEVLKLLQDSDGVPINVLSIPKNGSVTHEKTPFFTIGKNLFNNSEVIKNKGFASGGELLDSTTNSATKIYIYVGDTNEVISNQTINVVKYNEAYEYVSFKGYPSGTVIPTNDAEYIRFSTNSNNMAGLQLEKGNVITSFEPFKHSLRNVEIAKNDIDPKLTRDVEEATKTLSDIMEYPKNLVNTKTMYDGYSIDVNGDLQQSDVYTTTDFIPIKGMESYIPNKNVTMAMYDSNKNHKRNRGLPANTPIETQEDVAFARLATNIINKESLQFEKGTNVTDFEPYHEPRVRGTNASNTVISSKKIIYIGDSNTHLNFFPKFIEERTGSYSYNGGFGGTRLTDWSKVSTENNYHKICGVAIADAIATQDFSALITATEAIDVAENQNSIPKYRAQLQNIIEACENMDEVYAIVLKYGTNDVNGTSFELGSEDGFDTVTWNGAINYFIKTVSEAYPHIRIYFSAPVFRQRMPQSDEFDGIEKNSDEWAKSVMLPDMVEAMRKRCKVNHVPFKDLYNESGINKYTAPYYLKDKTHYSLSGDALVSQKLEGFLLSH